MNIAPTTEALSPEEPIKSPLNMNLEFDYDRYRDETTVKAISSIFHILGENAEALSPDSKATTETIVEAFNPVAEKIIHALIEHKVPDGDMQHVTESVQMVIYKLFNTISRMKTEYEKEFLARAMNARNPGDNHYCREYGTLGDLYSSLEKIRTEQKDDPQGYFYVSPK